MDWSSLVSGVGGFLLGALSLWFAYKTRGSFHREFLYQKQVEAYAAVTNALDTLYDACLDFITVHGLKLDNQTRPKLRKATVEVRMKFHKEHRKWALFLPSFMHDEIASFIKVLNAISAPMEVVSQYPKELVYSKDPQMDLSRAYSRVVAAARRGLGTESLSKEILRVVGETTPPIGEREASKTS